MNNRSSISPTLVTLALLVIQYIVLAKTSRQAAKKHRTMSKA